MDFPALRRRLLELDVACFCDADKDLRVMDPGMRPLRSGSKLAGRAFTVSCDDDFLAVIKALQDAQPGEVLVVDTHGSRRAVAGELFSREAQRRGLAGLVVDGAVRDCARVCTFDIPVYARSLNPMAGTTRRVSEIQVAVRCGGIEVRPGDVLFGDDDGVLVATESHLAGLLDAAAAIQRAEQDVFERIERGESLLSLLNFDEHYRKVLAGEDSRLRFG